MGRRCEVGGRDHAMRRNPEARIFEIAYFGIVRNLFEVVLAVIEERKKLQAER